MRSAVEIEAFEAGLVAKSDSYMMIANGERTPRRARPSLTAPPRVAHIRGRSAPGMVLTVP
jgi:hypothetical protein